MAEDHAGSNYICLMRSAGEENSLSINTLKKISENELDAIKQDDKIVRDYFHSKNVLDSVCANRDDIIKAMVEAGNAYVTRLDIVEQIMDNALFDIARLIANTCSLFRSFVDHSDRSLAKIFGKESAEYASWKAILSEEYDSNPHYRLMYHMRNYIQHYDMPPLGINFFESKEEVTMDISIDIKYLEEDKNMTRKLPKEMVERGNKISVIEVLSRWDKSLDRLADYVLRLKISQSIDAARRIASMRFGEEIAIDGKLVVIWLPHFDNKPDKLSLNMFNISEKKLDKL